MHSVTCKIRDSEVICISNSKERHGKVVLKDFVAKSENILKLTPC